MSTGILAAIISGVVCVIMIECIMICRGKNETLGKGGLKEKKHSVKAAKTISLGAYERKRTPMGEEEKEAQMGKVIYLKDRLREKKINSVKMNVQEEIKKVSPLNKQWWM